MQQFDGYSLHGETHENGRLVVGEALADLGGATLAWRAFQRATAGAPRLNVDGFTPEQRFFLAWARMWTFHVRPEAVRFRASTVNHPLAANRVNGSVSNMPEFAEAFHCAEGEAMVRPPPTKCSLW